MAAGSDGARRVTADQLKYTLQSIEWLRRVVEARYAAEHEPPAYRAHYQQILAVLLQDAAMHSARLRSAMMTTDTTDWDWRG